MHPILDPRRPHLVTRMFVPIGAALLLADMALGEPLGGLTGWGWVYFTILLAVGVSPYVALPFLVACVALVLGSRMGTSGEADAAIRPIPLAVIVATCALWFLVMLVVHLVSVTRAQERRAAGPEDPAA